MISSKRRDSFDDHISLDHTPQQLTLAFALWTRRATGELTETRLGVQLQERLIGKYLRRWGSTRTPGNC